MILPGFGIISELVTIHSRKSILVTKLLPFLVLLLLLDFFRLGTSYVHKWTVCTCIRLLSLLTYGVAVPTAIKVFSWVATLYKGSNFFYNTNVLYVCFLFLFLIGGLTGIFLVRYQPMFIFNNTLFLLLRCISIML